MFKHNNSFNNLSLLENRDLGPLPHSATLGFLGARPRCYMYLARLLR